MDNPTFHSVTRHKHPELQPDPVEENYAFSDIQEVAHQYFEILASPGLESQPFLLDDSQEFKIPCRLIITQEGVVFQQGKKEPVLPGITLITLGELYLDKDGNLITYQQRGYQGIEFTVYPGEDGKFNFQTVVGK